VRLLIRDREAGARLYAQAYDMADKRGQFDRGCYYLRLTRCRTKCRAVGLWPKAIKGKPGPPATTIDRAVEAAVRFHRLRGVW